MKKTKCSLLIYNKAIVYVGFKCYTYLCGEYKLIYVAFILIEQYKHCCMETTPNLNLFQ